MLDWIKANKKLALAGVTILAGGIALATGAITWEQFMSLFERVQELEGGSAADSLSLDSLGG